MSYLKLIIVMSLTYVVEALHKSKAANTKTNSFFTSNDITVPNSVLGWDGGYNIGDLLNMPFIEGNSNWPNSYYSFLKEKRELVANAHHGSILHRYESRGNVALNIPDFVQAINEFLQYNTVPNMDIVTDSTTLCVHLRTGDAGVIDKGFLETILRISPSFKRTVIFTGVHADTRFSSNDEKVEAVKDSLNVIFKKISNAVFYNASTDAHLAMMHRCSNLLVHKGGFSCIGSLVSTGTLYITDLFKHYTREWKLHQFCKRLPVFLPYQKSVVVYSINLNSYDTPVTHVHQSYPCQFVEYTECSIADDARNSYEASKKFRMSAHLLPEVRDADIAIYLDGNVQITDKHFVRNVVRHHDRHRWDFMMSPHEQRLTNTEEIDECLKMTKYSKEGLEMQRTLMESKSRLCWCGFNARWLTSPLHKHVKFLMDTWWFLVKMDPYGVANDQICFPKALDISRNALRPLNFSCDWQKEYMQDKSFHVHLTHVHSLIKRSSLPLENRRIRERVRLYILCYSEATFAKARDEFLKYYWARPILLDNLDASFENVFYKQLSKYDDWQHLDMVGTLSHSAHAKIDVYKVHCYIESGAWKEVHYVNFALASPSIDSESSQTHGPVFLRAWDNLYASLKGHDERDWAPPETLYNFWMCTPQVMELFVDWQSRVLKHCFSTPLFMENGNYNGSIATGDLMRVCGTPFYPIMPFVLERFNVLFFATFKLKFFGVQALYVRSGTQ